jgi:hypothetical protein
LKRPWPTGGCSAKKVPIVLEM